MGRCRALLLVLLACGTPTPTPAMAVPAQPPQPSAPAPARTQAVPNKQPPSLARTPSPTMVHLSTADPVCGLDGEGRVWHWNGGEMERVATSIVSAKSVACGMVHGCVVGADAAVWCWGRNDYGALGDGTDKEHHEVPVRAVGLAGIVEVGVDYARTCARNGGGDVYCWGDSEFGKAGDGRMPDNVGREKLLAGKAILGGAATLGVGSAHACAVMLDGKLSCWGQNNSGSCGQPLKTQYVPRPKPVSGASDLAAVSAGESITCTLDKRGAVSCWGRGSEGVLGPNGPKDDSPRDRAVAIPLPAPAVEIAADNHVCARLANGDVYCWGNNDHGQLGDGTRTSRPTPAPVKNLGGKASRIATGLGQSCAIVEGRVACWGDGMQRPDPSSRLEDALQPVVIVPKKD